MDGTLSPDGMFVLHRSEWIPASLSPDHIWYAHEGQWHPLSPPSAILARKLYSPAAGQVQTKQSTRVQKNEQQTKPGSIALSLIGIIVSLWFTFDSSARGLFYPSILDVSWLDMAGFNCSGFDDPLFGDLVYNCRQSVVEAKAMVLAGLLSFALFFFLLLTTK